MWQLMMWEPTTTPANRSATQVSLAAEQAQLNRLRKQVDDRWRTLVQAQERSAQPPADMLERLYDAYMRALDAYVARTTRPHPLAWRAAARVVARGVVRR